MQPVAVTTTGPMTVREWAAMPEDEPGELCEGFLEGEEVADLTHETAVVWLIALLRAWIVPQGGFVFSSDAKYALNNVRGRKPDVSVFFAGRQLPRRGAVAVPPDIAIEVVSPAPADQRRDRIAKLADYAAFGVRFYWLLDPSARTLEILELAADGRYIHVLGAAEGQLPSVPGCPGLMLDLDELWREIDRLGPDDSVES